MITASEQEPLLCPPTTADYGDSAGQPPDSAATTSDELIIPIVPQLRPVATLQLSADVVDQIHPGTPGGLATGDCKHYSGVFTGVVVPTCEFMWSVLLFVRFGVVVGKSGVPVTVLLLFVCAITVLVTLFSIARIASNSLPHGKVYRILETSLGRGIGGGIALSYYLGLTVLVGVEVVGSAQALLLTVRELCRDSRFDWTATGSLYWDQVLLAVATLAICTALACTLRVSHVVAQLFLVILVASFLFMMAGLLIAAVRSESSRSVLVSNMWPDPQHFSLSETLSYLFPCFLGMFVGVNNSRRLRAPASAISTGGTVSILTSLLLYTVLAVLFGAAVPHDTLIDNPLIGPELAWPWSWVTVPGVYIVGLGSAMQCLLLAASVLQSLAGDYVLPEWTRHLSLDREFTTVPVPAILFTVGLALLLAFVSELEVVAKIATMCFLLCYGSINLACFLLSAFKSPDWRPKKNSHWSLFAVGCCLCFLLMFQIQWYWALAAFVTVCVVAYFIQTTSTSISWGTGFQGLIFHVMVKYLLSAESEETRRQGSVYLDISAENGLEVEAYMPQHATISPAWRPQIVTFVPFSADGSTISTPRLVSFISQLKTRTSLCIFATVIPKEELPRRDNIPEQCQLIYAMLHTCRVSLRHAMTDEDVEGFVKVFTAPTVRVGQRLLLSTVGIGDLTPNILIVAWPSAYADHARRHRVIYELQDLWQMTTRLGLSYMICKGLERFPTSQMRLAKSIDVWWIVHDGQLLLLIAYLLKQHPVWADCSIRLFCLCHIDDDMEAVERELYVYLAVLRIRVETVTVVPIRLLDPSFQPTTSDEVSGRQQAPPQYKRFRHTEVASKLAAELESDLAASRDTFDEELPSDAEQLTGDLEAYGDYDEGSIHLRTSGGSGISARQYMDPDRSDMPLLAMQRRPTTHQERVLFVNAMVIQQLRAAIHTHSSDADLVVYNLPAPTRRNQQFSFGYAATGMYLELVDWLMLGIKRSVLLYANPSSRE